MSRLLRSLLLTAAVSGALVASALAATPADKPAAASRAVNMNGLTPQVLYQFLIAEIATQRGQFGLAASAYADLAKTTRNARVARRAAEIGLHTRQFEYALEAARIWNEVEPDEPAARQILANVLAASNRIEEFTSALEKDLAAAGPKLDIMLLNLNRLLARFPDKIATQRLVEQVTVPYISRPEAHFARAQAAVVVNNPERARQSIDEALRLRPEWEMAAVFKAQQMQNGTERAEFLQKYLATNPGAQEARLSYARTLVGEKRYVESLNEFRSLLTAHPDNADVINAVGILSLQLENPKEAEIHFRRLLELGKGDLNPVRFYLGQIVEDSKNFDEALKLYDAIDGGEHQTAALLRGAQILYKQGKLDEARQRLQKARSLLPHEAPQLLIAESQLLRDAGRNEDALKLLLGGLEANPEQAELLYEVALAAERANRLTDAEAYLRRLIKLKPESPQAYNALGYTLADRGERLDEAEQLIDTALKLTPDDPFILDSKGWVLFRKGQHSDALVLLRRAYALRPDPEIVAHIGEVLWAMGKHDEASALWRDAAKAHPANAVLSATIKRFTP
jgi:tetratricopeptide (TPR) repeat protein